MRISGRWHCGEIIVWWNVWDFVPYSYQYLICNLIYDTVLLHVSLLLQPEIVWCACIMHCLASL